MSGKQHLVDVLSGTYRSEEGGQPVDAFCCKGWHACRRVLGARHLRNQVFGGIERRFDEDQFLPASKMRLQVF